MVYISASVFGMEDARKHYTKYGYRRNNLAGPSKAPSCSGVEGAETDRISKRINLIRWS